MTPINIKTGDGVITIREGLNPANTVMLATDRTPMRLTHDEVRQLIVSLQSSISKEHPCVK